MQVEKLKDCESVNELLKLETMTDISVAYDYINHNHIFKCRSCKSKYELTDYDITKLHKIDFEKLNKYPDEFINSKLNIFCQMRDCLREKAYLDRFFIKTKREFDEQIIGKIQ